MANAGLIGLLSDSHDHRVNLRAGLELLRPYEPGVYIHLGDICDADVLDLLAGLGGAVHFVFGNNDYDHAALRATAGHWGLTCHGIVGRLTVAGKAVAFLHGDHLSQTHRLLLGQEFDYVFHGHTHRVEDSRFGKTRVINPGALYRAAVKTVGLLDVGADRLEILPLPASP